MNTVTDRAQTLDSCFAALGRNEQIELDGDVSLDYWVAGTGPVIVLVHGLLATALHWSQVVPILAETHTVYTPEMPFGGHRRGVGAHVDVGVVGQSELVTRFCHALDLNDVCVVGNDTGGTIAQLVAVNRPRSISRVVISDSDAFHNLPPAVFKYLCWMACIPALLSAAMAVPARMRFLQCSPFAFGWLTKRGLPPSIAEHYLALFRRSGDTRDDLVRFLRGVDNVASLRAAQRFSTVDCPVLVLWSRDDKVFPYEHAQQLATAIHGARLESCSNAYAYLPFDKPEWFARHVAEFHTARR